MPVGTQGLAGRLERHHLTRGRGRGEWPAVTVSAAPGSYTMPKPGPRSQHLPMGTPGHLPVEGTHSQQNSSAPIWGHPPPHPPPAQPWRGQDPGEGAVLGTRDRDGTGEQSRLEVPPPPLSAIWAWVEALLGSRTQVSISTGLAFQPMSVRPGGSSETSKRLAGAQESCY